MAGKSSIFILQICFNCLLVTPAVDTMAVLSPLLLLSIIVHAFLLLILVSWKQSSYSALAPLHKVKIIFGSDFCTSAFSIQAPRLGNLFIIVNKEQKQRRKIWTILR